MAGTYGSRYTFPVARILWDFDFLRGLAPGHLDGFSIGRYEKNRESFDIYAAKFESGGLEPFQNKVSSLVLLSTANSNSFKIAQ